jgi:hypothetical protein
MELLRKTSNQSYHAAKPNVTKSEERRSEIAFMLDQATRFAGALQESMGGKQMHPCASTPLLSPALNALVRSGPEQQQPVGMPPRHPRYHRRNSFVIHRNHMLPHNAVACQNATFPTPKLAESMDKTGSLGLTQLESHLVLKRAAAESLQKSRTIGEGGPD